MNETTELVCCDNSSHEKILTIGKRYSIASSNGEIYYIRGDSGQVHAFMAWRFCTCKQWRSKKLENLLGHE